LEESERRVKVLKRRKEVEKDRPTKEEDNLLVSIPFENILQITYFKIFFQIQKIDFKIQNIHLRRVKLEIQFLFRCISIYEVHNTRPFITPAQAQ